MSLPIFSAFEAHIVNVTATIDNPVKVLTPNNGEIFSIGECHIIKWTVDERMPRPGDINSIDLYYSTNGGITYPNKNKITTISSGINNNNVNTYCFDWLVPDDPTDRAKIMALIDYADPEIPDQVDYSDENFDITYTVDEDATVALWHFNEESGDIASDETGNNNGTLKPELSPPVWTTNGRYKNALEFNGIDDYVEVLDSDSLDITDQITIEAWIKADTWENPGALNVRNILDKGEHTTGKAYGLYSYNGKLHFRINKTSAADVSLNLPSLGEWHYIVGTYDGVKIKLYIDNGTPAEKNYSENILTNDEPLYIGAGVNRDYYFDGVIDEVRISNIARNFNNECENNGCNGEGNDPPPEDDPPTNPVPPEPGEVVINELMWTGSSRSNDDQWIELRNISSSSLNLKGCKLEYNSNSGNENKIAYLPDDTDIILNPDNYYLISRYTKGYSNINITPDFGGTSKVNNFDYNQFQIKLYCPDVTDNIVEIDSVGDGSSSPAFGDNESPKKSMERCDNGTWQTATIGGTDNNWDSGAEEFGTPGAANSSCE